MKVSSKSFENDAFCAGPSLKLDFSEDPPAIVVTPSQKPKYTKDDFHYYLLINYISHLRIYKDPPPPS